MIISIYRIFNALGDSILLSSLIKHEGVRLVYYNRGELDTLKEVMRWYNLPPVEFVQTNGRIVKTMTHLVRHMYHRNYNLISPIKKVKPSEETYGTYQINSPQENAQDRSITLEEAKGHFDSLENIKDVRDCKNLKSLYQLIGNSRHHVSIDSGTAWMAVSMGVPTTVISNNSYYFQDAFFYMKYMEKQNNVKVIQPHGEGVRIPTKQEYEQIIKSKNIVAQKYEEYVNRLEKNFERY